MKFTGDGREIPVVWDGNVFVPARNLLVYCDATFEVGKRYFIKPGDETNPVTKFEAMFHASVIAAYGNLDVRNGRNFTSSSHFRYFLLIRAGYCDLEESVFANDEEAKKFETRMRQRRKTTGDYYMILRKGDVVQLLTAWSMAHQKDAKLSPVHKREAFREAANKVLEMLAGDLNVTVAELIEESLNNG